jgi:hypothetical protein
MFLPICSRACSSSARHLVAHDGRDLVVVELQLGEDAEQ